MKRHAWAVYLGLAALGALLYWLPSPLTGSGPFFNALGISSAIAIIVGVRLHRPARRLPWYLFAAGQTLFIAGDVIAYNYEKFFHAPLPFPSIADFPYLSVYPTLMAGLFLLIRHRSPGRDRASVIDSLIVAIGAGLISWVFLMAPSAEDPNLSLSAKLIAMAYPFMDLALLSVLARLAVGPGKKERSFYLLLLSGIALFVTDFLYGLVLQGNYQPGNSLDLGWLMFYVLWGAAALHPSMRTLDEPTPQEDPKRPRLRLAMLASASLMAPAVQLLQFFRGHNTDTVVISTCSAVLFILVLLRMNELMIDITEYRKTERQLKETEAKYRTLVERLPAVVYIAEFGEKGRWLYVSPQVKSVLGFTPEEWGVSPDIWYKRIHPEDRERAMAEETRALQSGERLKCEYRIIGQGGRIVWIRDEAEILRDEAGEPTHLQGVMYDITDQKRAETQVRESLAKEKEAGERLRHLNEMKNSFLQAVSHDLRTPLTTILGTALTLERNDGRIGPEQVQELTRGMAANAKKLHRLLTNLLDLDRLSRSTVEPRRYWVDLREVALGVINECSAEDHPTFVDVPPLKAKVDGAQVERIIENLVTNAVRYTPPGTPIWVKAASQDGGVLLTVEDAGPGIPKEIKDTIFEPFEQGGEIARHSPGVGIGLSLVARFAELHDGRAWVEEGQEGGALFKVFLSSPTASEEVPESPSEEPPATHSEASVAS